MTLVAPKEPPPHWASDSLTATLDMIRANEFASFVRKPERVVPLIEIDAILDRYSLLSVTKAQIVPKLLLLEGHAAFRFAAGLAMAGAHSGVYPLGRKVLECGAYALHVTASERYLDAWINRDDDEDARRACKTAFKFSKLQETLARVDADLLRVFDDLYNRTLDFGAHPNQAAIAFGIHNMHPSTNDIGFTHLSDKDMNLDHLMKTTAQIGYWLVLSAKAFEPAKIESCGFPELRAKVLEWSL